MSFNTRVAAGIFVASVISGSASAQEAIFDKARPDYQPNGIRVGSFDLKGNADITETFDDNIYSAGDGRTVDDLITTIAPALNLESNWNNHELNFYSDAKIRKYYDESSEDRNEFTLGTDGRVDIIRGMYVDGGLEYARRTQERGSADNNTNAVEPTEFDLYTARAGFYRGVSRYSFDFDVDAKKFNFDDDETRTGAIIDNDDRDRKEYKTTGKLGYEIYKNYQAFLRGTYNRKSYDNDLVIDRDSDGYEAVVGTDVNISGKLRGEVFAGYMEQDYNSAAFKDIEGASYGASLLWNPIQITSVDFGVERTIEETSIAAFSGYTADTYSLRVEHELLRNVLLGANGSYALNDYEGNTNREDKITTLGAEVKYLINRNASAKLGYEFSTRDSNANNQDYDKNIFLVGLGLGF